VTPSSCATSRTVSPSGTGVTFEAHDRTSRTGAPAERFPADDEKWRSVSLLTTSIRPELAPVAARVASSSGPAAMVAVLAAAAVPGLLDTGLLWVVLAGGLLVGVPHGAVDHLVPEWLLGRRLPVAQAAAGLIAYVTTAAGFFWFLRVAPLPSTVVFLVVSAAHFGAGDVEFHALRRAETPRYRPLAVAAFGLPTVALPIAVHVDQVEPVLSALAPGLATLVGPEVRILLVTVTVAAAAITAWRASMAGDRHLVLDLIVLVAVFTFAPPLAAFAGYFGFWHAARHVGRLLSLDPRNAADLANDRIGRPLWRFARLAALPTVASLLVLAGLWWGAGGAEGLVSAHLGLLAALTMPHVAVVAWLDRTGRRTRADALPEVSA
jgi:Brp/Blh family beta-carotene 15,15'-monooxygenase